MQRLCTEFQCPDMPVTSLKVCLSVGGGWYGMEIYKPIIVCGKCHTQISCAASYNLNLYEHIVI